MKPFRLRARCAWLVVLVLAGCAPRDTNGAPPSAASLAPATHTYREVGGTTLAAHVFVPRANGEVAPRPAIVLLHGGGWVVGSPEWTFDAARRWAAAGLVAVSVQYRLSDDSVTPIDAAGDVCVALRWVRAESRRWNVDPNRVAAAGVSAGGHLAAAAATIGCGNGEGAYDTGGPDALLLWSPALDVSRDRHFVGLLRGRASGEAWSPVEHVRERMPPVHVVHGERDSLTPVGGVERFCERVRAGGNRCELAIYPGLGHLLTRNLESQEDDFDPDPAAREDGIAKELAFVRSLWTP
jgi:acetyl esterase/lipase